MKKLAFYTGMMAILIAVAIGTGCQTPPAANSGNAANSSPATTDHSGHDMSNMNMNGHDMSKMDHGSSAPGAKPSCGIYKMNQTEDDANHT